jgi:hypothetical protein
LDARFDTEMANYIREHPMFTKQENSDPSLLGAPQVPPELRGNVAAAINWARSMGVEPGGVISLGGGRYKHLPGATQ